MPADPPFNQKNNPFDQASCETVCLEFGINPKADFRYTKGSSKTYHDNRYSVYKRHPDDSAYNQYDWFCPNIADGLTNAGLGRINQSIQAFVICVLGAQVKLRKPIVGRTGNAIQAQNEFMRLFEESVKQNDPSQINQDYLTKAKTRLDLAVGSGVMLLPSYKARNTTTIVGCNNQLQEAVKDDPRFRLGKNDWLNSETKSKPTVLQHEMMDGGPSKFKPARRRSIVEEHQQQQQQQKPGSPAGSAAEQHEENKIVLILGQLAIAALAFFGLRR